MSADLIDRRVPLEVWANPIKNEHGRVESVVAAFQDITQRKQVEAELVEYRHQLERLVEQRTEQLSAANAQLQVENAERRRYEDMLRSRMEWLVVVNQVSQAVSKTSDLPRAYQDFRFGDQKFVRRQRCPAGGAKPAEQRDEAAVTHLPV